MDSIKEELLEIDYKNVQSKEVFDVFSNWFAFLKVQGIRDMFYVRRFAEKSLDKLLLVWLFLMYFQLQCMKKDTATEVHSAPFQRHMMELFCEDS